MQLEVQDPFAQQLGLRFSAVGDGAIDAELDVRPELLAPNGFLHAGALISLADMACGFGSLESLPRGRQRRSRRSS